MTGTNASASQNEAFRLLKIQGPSTPCEPCARPDGTRTLPRGRSALFNRGGHLGRPRAERRLSRAKRPPALLLPPSAGGPGGGVQAAVRLSAQICQDRSRSAAP